MRGLGREVLDALRQQQRAGGNLTCVGFAIDPGFPAPETLRGIPVRRDDPNLEFVIGSAILARGR